MTADEIERIIIATEPSDGNERIWTRRMAVALEAAIRAYMAALDPAPAPLHGMEPPLIGLGDPENRETRKRQHEALETTADYSGDCGGEIRQPVTPQPEAPTATSVCKTCGGSKFVEVTYPEGYQPGFDDVGRVSPCPTCYAPFLRKGSVAEQPVTPQPVADAGDVADWRDDPSADERWNAGLDFGMMQLCAALGVDADSISFDAATETLDGDVQSVMWRILRARFGEDFPDLSQSEQIASLTKERDNYELIARSKVVSHRDLDTLRAEAAESRLAELEQEAVKVVEPFAKQADTHGKQVPDSMFIDDYERDKNKPWYSLAGIRVGELRAARTFLSKLKGSAS